LDLSWNPLGNAGVDKIRHVIESNQTIISYLDLHDCGFDYQVISRLYIALKRNGYIQFLILDGNNIGGKGNAHLS